MSYRDRICNLLSSCLAGKNRLPWKDWFIRIDMRVQLHCIARIHVVYLKQVDLLASLHGTTLFPRSPLSPRSTEKKYRTGTNSSSRKKGPTEPEQLTNTNIIEKNRKELSFLYTFPGSVATVPRALRNGSDHIDIPSTQHRSSKRSRTTHQSTKARIFQKMDSYLIWKVHNRMDKLTPTR